MATSAVEKFHLKYRWNERAQEWLENLTATNNERGAFATPDQHDIWSQMRFESDLVDTYAKFVWWEKFIKRHSITCGPSADLMRIAPGKCELFICFFEFRGIPCIVVPVYINQGVGLAQGIVKTTRNFDTHSYLGLHVPAPDEQCSDELNTIIPHVENLGIFLLAQVCCAMKLEFLFASPIDFFRDMLFVYLEYNGITHWMAPRLDSSVNGVHSDDVEGADMSPLPSWWCPRYPAARRLTLAYDEDSYFDLGYITKFRDSDAHVPRFEIIAGKWNQDADQHKGVNTGEIDNYCDTFYPYNFLWMLGGEGMVIVRAPDFATYAPMQPRFQ